jgi:hypothetical protein
MRLSSILITGASAALVALMSTSAMAGCGSKGCKVETKRSACAATGSCRTVVRQPVRATYRTVRVVVTPASERVVREPAVYEFRRERVMIRRAGTTVRYIPPVYATRAESVLVRPASVTYRYEPAVYKTVSRKVVSSGCETRLVRTRGCGGCVSTCTVSKPVTRVGYVTDRVLVQEARRVAVRTPAEYATRKTLVEVKPGRSIVEYHPAEYINRTVHVKVRDGRCYTVRTPAVYATRKERVGGSCGSSCSVRG